MPHSQTTRVPSSALSTRRTLVTVHSVDSHIQRSSRLEPGQVMVAYHRRTEQFRIRWRSVFDEQEPRLPDPLRKWFYCTLICTRCWLYLYKICVAGFLVRCAG